MSDTAYEGWAILELMGHRRLGGQVKQVEQYGAAMVRIDVPAVEDHAAFTQFYGGGSIYSVTPTTEEIAHYVANLVRAAPVSRFEMPSPAWPEPGLFGPPECSRCGEPNDDCSCGGSEEAF
jgi:hypothetical protein